MSRLENNAAAQLTQVRRQAVRKVSDPSFRAASQAYPVSGHIARKVSAFDASRKAIVGLSPVLNKANMLRGVHPARAVTVLTGSAQKRATQTPKKLWANFGSEAFSVCEYPSS